MDGILYGNVLRTFIHTTDSYYFATNTKIIHRKILFLNKKLVVTKIFFELILTACVLYLYQTKNAN